MSREIMQQALTVLKAWDALIKYQYGGSSEAMTAMQNVAWRTLDTIEGLEAALAQPEQEPTACGYDETVGMCTNNPCCEQAQPEQEPVAKHVCNLWINPETSFYEVDRCTHPINEVIPVYTAPPRKEWVGLTEDDMHTIRGDAFNKNVDDMNWAVAMARKIDFILRQRNT